MKRKFRQRQWKGLLPQSTEILGALARLCDWQPVRSARERTWRKFCQGEHIDGRTRRAIVEEMIENLVRKLGSFQAPDARVEPLAQEQARQALSELLIVHAALWDLMCQKLQGAMPAQPTAFTTTVALRLAVVEVAMRLGGLFQLHGVNLQFPANLGEDPVDVHRLLLPYVLRAVLKEAGITRMALAEALGVSKEAVDQWLESKTLIPSQRIDEIAQLVASKKDLHGNTLALGMRAVRKVSQALMPLAELIGEDELGRLLLGLMRLLAVTQVTLQGHLPTLGAEARAEALATLIAVGGHSPLGVVLRTAMQEKVTHESWTRAIATPPGLWMQFLGDVSAVETAFTRVRTFFTEQDFPVPEQQQERLRQQVLLPRDSPENPYAPLFALPPGQGALVYLAYLWKSFESVDVYSLDPKELQNLGVLAQVSGLMVEISEGQVKTLADDLRWRCLGLFILGCMRIGQTLVATENLPEMKLWADRMMKALRGLPPFPSAPSPEAQPIFKTLRLLKQIQEELDEGKTPTVGPTDFDFINDLKPPAKAEAPVAAAPPPPA